MMMIGSVTIGVGILLLAIAAIGLIRFPDFFTRVHAVSKAETLGISLVLLGMMMHAGLNLISLKLALIALFIAIANPVGTHLLTRSAIRSGFFPLGSSPRRPVPDGKER